MTFYATMQKYKAQKCKNAKMESASKRHLHKYRKMVGYTTGIIGTAISAEGVTDLVYEKREGGHFGLRVRLWL